MDVKKEVAPSQSGVFIQQNGSMIPLRGGILRPAKGTYIRSVRDIENLPWTKDGIVDAHIFRLCDEFVRKETTDWETKRQAIFAMIFHSHGYIGPITDAIIQDILDSSPYAEDDNDSMVKLWQLGDMNFDTPLPREFED